MLSKEQADVIGDQLLNKARDYNAVQNSILRRSRCGHHVRFIFPIMLVSQLIIVWMRHQKNIPDVYYFFATALLCIFGIFAIVVGIYQKRTPLIRIADDRVLYYGSMPWRKKSFPLSEVNSVVLTKNRSPWRDAFQLSINVKGAETCIWLPIGKPSHVPLVKRTLSAHFKDWFTDSEI